MTVPKNHLKMPSTTFLIILIVFSSFTILVTLSVVLIPLFKTQSPAQMIFKTLLQDKKFELTIGLLAHILILVGAIGLLKAASWGNAVALTGLVSLLAYVWIENLWKIQYFKKMQSAVPSSTREEVSQRLEQTFEPMGVDITEEVDLDDSFYQTAAQQQLKKTKGRIVVGTLMLAPAIYYLLG